MTSAPHSRRSTASHLSHRPPSSFVAWPTARPNTWSRSGPRVAMRPPPRPCALFVRSAPADIVEAHLAKISQDKDQLRRDSATAERLLGDRVGDVRDTVEKLRTRDGTTTRRKRGST